MAYFTKLFDFIGKISGAWSDFGVPNGVMEDMPRKLRFFVNTGGKSKFKRAVPADIQSLVGKQNWVVSVGTLSPSELKVEADRFAAYTNDEIARHRAVLTGGASIDQQPPKINLTSSAVDEIIRRYRAERVSSRLMSRSFVVPANRSAEEILSDAEDDLANAVQNARGDTSISEDQTVGLLQQYGYAESAVSGWAGVRQIADHLENDTEFQRLVRLREIVDVQLAQQRLHALSNRDFDGVSPLGPAPAAPEPVLAKSITLKALTDRFMASKPANLTRSRRSQLELPIRLLLEWFGENTSVAAITREQCWELVEFLPTVPAYLAQHYRGLTIKQAAEAYLTRTGAYADRREEAQKYVEIARGIFEFAANERWIEFNPWRGIVISTKPIKKHLEKERSYQPFPISSLNKLFALPIWTGSGDKLPTEKYFLTHRYWAPIIALYSGMRMNEVLQLEKSDIREGDTGIKVFFVTDEEAEEYDPSDFQKRVKTVNAIRRIPIHPRLEDFGFLRWVSQRVSGRLFPEAKTAAGEKPSDNYSKRFHTDLVNADIWVPRRQVFHSFRNNFNDALRDGGTNVELREAINGWSEQRSMDSHYGAGHTDLKLFSEVAKAEYPGLETSCLERNAKLI
jgi:integrase